MRIALEREAPLSLLRLLSAPFLAAAAAFLVAAGLVAFSRAPFPVAMAGYTAPRGSQEQSIEAQLEKLTSAAQIQVYHRYLTSEPHPAASARNNELARWMADEWRKQGLEDVTIHEYDVWHSSPRKISLEMVAPSHYRAGLREDAYDADPDTKKPDLPGAYLGYSASGEVTAPVVYAHSGNPDDYDLLRQHRIEVRGKIVLVRYSNPYSYRGFKALTAQREGAAAILIYSDPAEDGYSKGPVFPQGPWGPESHIQRGSITYDFIEPGDPLTPGWASVPGAKRIRPEEAVSLPKIIALPLSWRDAKPMLANMDGPEAPESWQGGLGLRYHLGGKRVVAHLKVEMDAGIRPYYVAEARIRGAESPDEWVILGNHRDAWVYGGVDPSSGTAAMLELTRNLGELLKKGIRPRRTLVFCSWDGEEYALTGSTEWGEQYADELKQKAVAYLNVDEATSGSTFHGTVVGSLAPLLVDVSRTLPAPSGKTLYDEWKATRREELHDSGLPSDADLPDTRIGSGSDHTVFLNFLGIPTALLEFDGPYGVYHSVYDDFYWVNHFGDPGYRYHALLAQLWGAVALRLADADILPYDFASYGRNIHQFAETLDAATHIRSRLDLRPLEERIGQFEQAGADLNGAVAAALASDTVSAETLRRVNEALMQVERNWCHPAGLPGRAWFKHTIYATRYTYAHLELPGLTEAAEAGDWKRAAQQQEVLEAQLERNSELLRGALAILQRGARREDSR